MTGASLKAWRKTLGLSQEAASEALGCGRRAFGIWERGERDIPRYIALACAAVKRGLKPLS